MNKHVKCLLIFIAIIISASSMVVGLELFCQWLITTFGEVPVGIGIVVSLLAIVGGVTHSICKED